MSIFDIQCFVRVVQEGKKSHPQEGTGQQLLPLFALYKQQIGVGRVCSARVGI